MSKKLYLSKQNWNEEEKKSGKASYLTIANRFFENRVLCNNIIDVVGYEDLELVCGKDENEYGGIDIFQWFITDLSNWDLESLKELESEDIILYYSNKLDCYILAVDHLGTNWGYVSTDIELTDNLEEV